MTTWKKLSVLILITGLITTPITISSQTGEVGANELEQEVTKSLDEAVTIWEQMYNFARSFWYRQIGWRLAPVMERIENWINSQIAILREALREDAQKAEETIKKEVEQAGEEVKKSVWQMILEAVGMGNR